ncbi:MAG: hypothetical protein JSS32_00650 [Verrucomicrobia bacterium]|nr:hypothetical protein [Verrucomicrobiota bacterium]
MKFTFLLLAFCASVYANEMPEWTAVPKPEKKVEPEKKNTWCESLAEQATDFTAPLLQLQFQDWYNHNVWGTHTTSNTFLVRPVVPLNKTKSFPFQQLIRVSAYVVTTPKIPKHITGLGDTEIFDLFLYEIPEWGRIGVGPMAVLPSSTNQSKIGQGKWQLGPAFAAVLLAARCWQFGVLVQNPYGFLGNSAHQNVITLYVQPLITVHFRYNIYLISNAQMTFQWRPKSMEIPLNIGIGKVATIKGQPINAFLQAEWVVFKQHAEFQPHFTVKAGFHFLFPDKPTKLDKAGA